MANSNAPQYDIIIVGAGMVGAAAACLLAQSNTTKKVAPLKIALIETSVARPFDAGHFDPRVAAITEKSRQILADCGVWQAIENLRVSPYLAMNVWDAESTGRIRFDCHDIHLPNLGHIVESSAIVDMLLDKIQSLETVDFICPATICKYQKDQDMITVEMDDGRRISGSLLIGADGGNSKVRDHFNFDCKQWDYQHEAIVATIKTTKPNQQTAWQRFIPTGPLALLPLNNLGDLHHSSIVWSQQPSIAEDLMALDDKQFCDEIGRASEHCLGEVTSVSRRYKFPLRQNHAVDYVLPRVALVGDAAHTIHPLAGQGVNLGFADVAALAEEIARARMRDIGIGDESILKRYQRQRKPENLVTMAVMEGFKNLFSADQLPLRLLRSLGMSQLDKMMPLKKEIIKRAMGL
ncbi:UbiH/UbiF/VisC/COQ6 family ubiquinone biosynthesis hydroxylase [Gammaproteobacteria bacterium]|nr:UbiH/UbiF/VisC/COQ6 family ubiquinone biosynthesis hydroxylase [Gammaproteobacteria bacterium]|tara:strand:- start:723 stop:1943 length:1221 start_codon:yes stop_codon:yes gene_type:complete